MLSYQVTPEARAKGVAAQAVGALVRFCFERNEVDYVMGLSHTLAARERLTSR